MRVSFDNYRAVHPSLWSDDDTPREEVEERKDFKGSQPYLILFNLFSSFERYNLMLSEEPRNFKGRGISGKGKNIVTKHDEARNHRKNASKVTDKVAAVVQ